MNDIAIRVDNLRKCDHLYHAPCDRLKQFNTSSNAQNYGVPLVAPRLQRLAGQAPKQYFREFWALKDVLFEIQKGESDAYDASISKNNHRYRRKSIWGGGFGVAVWFQIG